MFVVLAPLEVLKAEAKLSVDLFIRDGFYKTS